MIRRFYLWGKRTLERIEIELDPRTDIEKKPKINKSDRMAMVHQRYLDRKNKKS
jgi:hypothetical protein